MSANVRCLLFCLLVIHIPVGCRQEPQHGDREETADARTAPARTCPKVGEALELADAPWSLKLVSFRFFRSIGNGSDVAQAAPGLVYALAEVEWSRSTAGTLEAPPSLALWDGRGDRLDRAPQAVNAFLKMQPAGRYGILPGRPAERFLAVHAFVLAPEEARVGLWLAPDGVEPPAGDSLRFCLGPFEVR